LAIWLIIDRILLMFHDVRVVTGLMVCFVLFGRSGYASVKSLAFDINTLKQTSSLKNVITRYKRSEKILSNYLPINKKEFILKYYKFTLSGSEITKYDVSQVDGYFKVIVKMKHNNWQDLSTILAALSYVKIENKSFAWLNNYDLEVLARDKELLIDTKFRDLVHNTFLNVQIDVAANEFIRVHPIIIGIKGASFLIDNKLEDVLMAADSELLYAINVAGHKGVIGKQLELKIPFSIPVPEDDETGEIIKELKKIAQFKIQIKVANKSYNESTEILTLKPISHQGLIAYNLIPKPELNKLRFFLDGKPFHDQLKGKHKLSVGTHQLNIESRLYKRYYKRFEVKKNKTITLNIVLDALPIASIKIYSDQDKADLYIDQKKKGVTPYESTILFARKTKKSITLVMHGYYPIEDTLVWDQQNPQQDITKKYNFRRIVTSTNYSSMSLLNPGSGQKAYYKTHPKGEDIDCGELFWLSLYGGVLAQIMDIGSMTGVSLAGAAIAYPLNLLQSFSQEKNVNQKIIEQESYPKWIKH